MIAISFAFSCRDAGALSGTQGRHCLLGCLFFGCFSGTFLVPVGAHHRHKTAHERGVRDVEVRAIPDGLLHTVREVSERANRPLARDREYRSQAVLGHDDVHVLSLQATKDCAFRARRNRLIVDEGFPVPCRRDAEGRVRVDLIGVKPTFEHKAAGDVPVQGLDMLLALRLFLVRAEMFERLMRGDPLADPLLQRIIRHNVSRTATWRYPPGWSRA